MKFRIFSIALAVLLGVILLCACSGIPNAVWGNMGRPGDSIPFMENVRTGTLPSGLRYFILENSLPENRAFLTLAVKAGSIHEEDHEQGLAHFVEHVAFSGTTRFPEAELLNYLRSLGMRFGPEVNAYVSFEQTVYGIETPVETDDNGVRRIPEKALAIIDDWTRAVTFLPEAVDKERPIILDEYRMRLGAWERLRQKYLPVLYRGSPYAERMPIGKPEIIENATAQHLIDFYRKWYKADNMALIFAGDFDGAALEASLIEHFHIEKPATPTRQPSYDLPLPSRRENIEPLVLTDPELTVTQINLFFRRSREPRRSDLTAFRYEIIDSLISTMLRLRFQDELVKPETPYIGASGYTSRFATSSRFYVLAANAKTGNTEEALEELLRAKESMSRYGFTDAEMAIASRSMVSGLQRQVQEKDRQHSNSHINSITSFYLRGGYLADAEWRLNAVQSLLPHITVKDINDVINDYFRHNDVQIFVFAPESEKANLPNEARITQLVRESRRMTIERPQPVIIQDSLLPATPDRGAVSSESVDEETGAVIWELSNGAKVILKSTRNRNDEIILHAMARGGTSCVSDEDDISARLAVEMLQVSGLGPWSRPELTRMLSGKQVSFSQSVSYYQRTFRGSSISGDLETLFEMLYLNFTNPRIDPEAVRAMLDQYASVLALRGENPGTAFSDEVERTRYSGHPRFKPLELADLQFADINTALEFIRRGLNPADYTFVFTGNLDLAAMKDFVEIYIASIQRGESWNTWTDLGFVRPGKIERTVNKGKEEQSRVNLSWYVPVDFSWELRVATQVLKEYLDIVLVDEIREKLGIYSIGAGVSVWPVPRGENILRIGFNCGPDQVQELTTAVIDLLNRTARSIDRDVFNKAVDALIKTWEVNMQSNSFIASDYLDSSVLLDLPLSRLDRRPLYINRVTPADIQQICASFLQSDSYGPVQVVLMPE